MLVEVALLVDAEHAERLADALLVAGCLSVSVEDADAGTPTETALYGEPGLEPERHAWRSSRLCALIRGTCDDAARLLAKSCAALEFAQPLIEGCATVEDGDWVRATQAQFPPTRISERLWIVPSWHEAPCEAIVVQLDPGVAFGTGTHPTTQLCLTWLDRYVTAGAQVLDYGCGSGILSIAAMKLGAGRAVGVDVDEQALGAARANATANGIPARYTAPGDLEPSTFDIVVANILSNPLKVLAPALLARVGARGALVLSGILERQAEELISTYRAVDPTVPLKVWQTSDGWVCLAGVRSA